MPLLLQKHRVPHRAILRDVRPVSQRFAEYIGTLNTVNAIAFGFGATMVFGWQSFGGLLDILDRHHAALCALGL